MEWEQALQQALATCQQPGWRQTVTLEELHFYLKQVEELAPMWRGAPFELVLERGRGRKNAPQNGTRVVICFDERGNRSTFSIQRRALHQTFFGVRLLLPLQSLTQAARENWEARGFCYMAPYDDQYLIYVLKSMGSATLASCRPTRYSELPVLAQHMLQTWGVVYPSPYSYSYYNTTDVGWDVKPVGSLRLSDHWNFVSHGRRHCQTTHSLTLTPGQFALGRYNGVSYEILRVFEVEDEAR